LEVDRIHYGRQYTDYQQKRPWFRKQIRQLYLTNILSHVSGPTLDLGCGIGELLEKLPKGSLGTEINQESISYCRQQHLNVIYYDLLERDISFAFLPRNHYLTCIISHVLEHFSTPQNVLESLFPALAEIGIQKIIVVVPGIKGFKSDPTHKKFINEAFLHHHNLFQTNFYAVNQTRYFPFNIASAGKIFTHNEWIVVYKKI
jgi:SAM-dependent methyltransferase